MVCMSSLNEDRLLTLLEFGKSVGGTPIMSNETIIADFVRSHFKLYKSYITLEEQKSRIKKIDSLLKNASKSGSGNKGYPDFIISNINGNSEFVIIVECKGNIVKHGSKTGDQYADYAIDGVLLYSSHLSKSYDVLSIAVSGNEDEQKSSHYLQLKGTTDALEQFGNTLLSPENYLQSYLKSPLKFDDDSNRLLDFSKVLNQKLHSLMIAESKRSLLISAILMSLDNKAFTKAYQEFKNGQALANFLVRTVIDELAGVGIEKNRKISKEYRKNLEIQFSFIKTEPSLVKEKRDKEKVLMNLIDDIRNNVVTFTKTHKYYDILGQLYTEFLRYANAEKGLGIVLTPHHITELCVELAEIDKNSVVYDSCAGTGGFLITAMRKMILEAKEDRTKIDKIKHTQLVAVEYQPHIYALTVSNMYIHQDGKTSIIHGNCFDKSSIEQVKEYKPSVGLLNPPFKSDKKRDKEELEFVLNNLECLSENGKCVAIVPIPCVLANHGKRLELKKQLLANHTLEAVMSMPIELFSNSKVSVVTVILVFTAKKPHPKGKKTWFGYWRDDGFEKVRGKGRIDKKKLWKKIMKEWINLYKNREVQNRSSVMREIEAKDEWCAEAYLETDYSLIVQKDFEKAFRQYVAYNILKGE